MHGAINVLSLADGLVMTNLQKKSLIITNTDYLIFNHFSWPYIFLM